MKWVLYSLLALGGLVAVVALIGAALPQGHVATRTARFKQSPEAVWRVVTDYRAFPSWRTDLQRVDPLPEKNGRTAWREVGRNGEIAIEIVESVPSKRLVTRIADPDLPFGGNWTYVLTASDSGTTLAVTENGEVYNPIFRFMSRFIFGHHATLETYLKQLGRKFGEEVTPA